MHNPDAPGSQLALSFDGNAFYDDLDTGAGSRGVYVNAAAFQNNDPVSGENTAGFDYYWNQKTRQGVRGMTVAESSLVVGPFNF